MAEISNAYDTYTAVGNREDLSDIIYNIDPYDTPFMSSIRRRNVQGVNFEWQTDTLEDADLNNAQAEGFELSRTASKPTVRLHNVCQISKKDVTVTRTQAKANIAGKKSEMAYQVALKSKSLKRDMDSILCQTQMLDDGTAGGTHIRKTRAFESWVSTNTNRGTGGADPVISTNTGPVDGTTRSLTEAIFRSVLLECYISGASPQIALVPAALKQVISTFTGRANTRQTVNKNTVYDTISIYASDFFDVRIIPSRRVRASSILLIDPTYVALSFYRNFALQDMAIIGDADTRMLVVEYGLEMNNEKAHGVIADLKAA